MTEFKKNDIISLNRIIIENIPLAVYRENLAGDICSIYSNGRNVCGLVVAVNGEASYDFKDGTKQKIIAGQAALFSDKVAYIVTNKKNEPFVHYTINFTLAHGSAFNSDVLIRPVNFSGFSEKCKKFIELFNSGAPAADLKCMSVLYELVAEMLENNLMNNVGENTYKNILPAIHYIDSNYSSDISTDSLAKLCVMSNTNFRRVFTAVCGISPIQYLMNVRIRHANEFLSHDGYSIKEVSHLCGFNDVEHFCRTFKKKNGMTPREARKIYSAL